MKNIYHEVLSEIFFPHNFFIIQFILCLGENMQNQNLEYLFDILSYSSLMFYSYWVIVY